MSGSAIDNLKILLNSSVLFYFVIGGFAVLFIQFTVMVIGMYRVFEKLNLGGKKGGGGTGPSEEEIEELIAKRSQTYVKALETELEDRGFELEERYQGKVVKVNSLLSKLKNLASTLDKNQIFRITLDILYNGLNAEKCSIMIIDKDTGELLRVRSFEKKPDDEEMDESIFREVAPKDEPDLEEQSKTGFHVGDNTLVGIVAEKGGMLTKRSASNLPEYKGLMDNGPVHTEAVGAISVKNSVAGLLHIETTGEYEITQEDEVLFATICSMIGLTMESANLFELTKQDLLSTKQISKRHLEMTRTIRSAFEKFLSPKLVEQMLQHPDQLKLGGEKRELTVFFSDIRGFTTYSEKYEPEKVVSILNEYLTAMTDIILDHDGTLDKFVGDEIMAIWGAPVHQENHAELAVMAALEMLDKLRELQQSWKKQGLEPIDIGIGINTGEMVVGNMGSLKRMDYTVIGDNVNIGARLESLTRQYNCHMIISEATYEKVRNTVNAIELAPVTVKGKTKPINIYNVLGLLSGPVDTMPDGTTLSTSRLMTAAEEARHIDIDKELEVMREAHSPASKSKVREKELRNTESTRVQGEVLEAGMQKVVCQNCSHPNIGQTMVYCEKCGRPL